MNRSHTLRMATGYVVAAVLFGGAVSQVPWTTLAATVGLAAPTYDQAAVRRPPERPGAPAAGDLAHAPIGLRGRGTGPWPWLLGTGTSTSSTSPRQDGALVPPDDVSTLGRWDAGARPGDGVGTVVLVVHRDSWEQGRGPFAELEALPLGSRVTLDGETYRLDRLTTYPKGALPAHRVFGQGGPERLVVVTCGGTFSTTRGWDANVVASFGLVPA